MVVLRWSSAEYGPSVHPGEDKSTQHKVTNLLGSKKTPVLLTNYGSPCGLDQHLSIAAGLHNQYQGISFTVLGNLS